MRQALHLLIVCAQTGEALAAHYASRWLLPVITCGEHVRADPLAVRWAANRNIPCEVVGQWLGQVHPEVVDWLMVLNATRAARAADRQLVWTPLDALAAANALIPYQGSAAARTLARTSLPTVPGPFGRFEWLADVKLWIRQVAGESEFGRIRQFRSSGNEVVLSARTESGDVYFKGLSGERASEPHITQMLAAAAPGSFAKTLALEERANGATYWLTAACPGRNAGDDDVVGRALAAVQRRVSALPEVRQELPALDVMSVLEWVKPILHDAHAIRAVEESVDVVLGARVPQSWIPLDLHPTNMLVDDRGDVRFIDLDESFFGPAPLAMALFARRSGVPSSRHDYERAWSPPLTDIDWVAFDAVAVLAETWLGSRRIERSMRDGNVLGPLERVRARVRQRLLEAVGRR